MGAFAAFAHVRFGWSPDLAAAATLPSRVFEVVSFFALISFGLAHFYLIGLMLPLYALVSLNDTFYDASLWVLRRMFGMRAGSALSVAGLCGELLLFVGAAALTYHALL